MKISDEDGFKLSGDFLLCTIANGRFCGGAFRSSPYAEIDDGLMDFGGIRTFDRLSFLKLLPSYQNGTYLKKTNGRKKVHFKQCENLMVQAETPMFASVDGEVISFTSLEMKVEKQAARFILPKGATKIAKPNVME